MLIKLGDVYKDTIGDLCTITGIGADEIEMLVTPQTPGVRSSFSYTIGLDVFKANLLHGWYTPTGTSVPPSISSCECGKEKHGFTSHSTWCPIKE